MTAAPTRATRRLVFWEPCTSPHKAGLFAALAQLAPDWSIVQCAERGVDDERKALGWQDAGAAGVATLLRPSAAQIRELVAARPQESLHIFSGIRWVPTIVEGLRAVQRSGARFAIMSEPRAREGLRGELRFVQSWLTEHSLRRNVDFVLAIGRNGPSWFSSVGYDPARIVPFAYFVEPPRRATERSPMEKRTLRIGYLGRLVEEKGVFDLLASAALLNADCRYHFAGAGRDEARLRTAAALLDAETVFHGVLPMPDVGRFLSSLDILVLASTTQDDGWGVVVGEALMCGAAVVATDCVGASLVLDRAELGRVVPARRPALIADAVRSLANSGALEPAARERRAEWARATLSATAGAAHLKRVIAWSDGRSPAPAAFHLQGQSLPA